MELKSGQNNSLCFVRCKMSSRVFLCFAFLSSVSLGLRQVNDHAHAYPGSQQPVYLNLSFCFVQLFIFILYLALRFYNYIGKTYVVIRNKNADSLTSLILLIKIQEMAQVEYQI